MDVQFSTHGGELLLVYLEQAVNLWLLVFLVSGARGPGETAISEGQRSK